MAVNEVVAAPTSDRGNYWSPGQFMVLAQKEVANLIPTMLVSIFLQIGIFNTSTLLYFGFVQAALGSGTIMPLVA